MNTYWVEYCWDYKIITSEGTESCSDFNSDRFKCLKKNIKKEVEKDVKERLSEENYTDLKISITDVYPTTEYEI